MPINMTPETPTTGTSVSTPESDGDPLTIRPTSGADGATMWRLARDSGALDLNTSYAYLLLAREFGQTCRIAERGRKPVGFALAYQPPQRPGHLFVWQVGVADSERGRGLAGRMIEDLIDTEKTKVLEATVTETNQASRALFAGIARRRGATLTWQDFIHAEDFPDEGHEAEPMLQIAPLGGP